MKKSAQITVAKTVEQDYLLVITPSKEIIDEVEEFKKITLKRIGPFPSFNSKAHITINHYYEGESVGFDEREPTYRSMTSRTDAFEIEVRGFDFFEHEGIYTIYAKVELSENIKTTFKRFKFIFGKNVPQTPHITIARGLSCNQFKVLWAYFKTQKFECSFYADKIVVLKTPTRRLFDLPMEVETEFKLKKVI